MLNWNNISDRKESIKRILSLVENSQLTTQQLKKEVDRESELVGNIINQEKRNTINITKYIRDATLNIIRYDLLKQTKKEDIEIDEINIFSSLTGCKLPIELVEKIIDQIPIINLISLVLYIKLRTY